MSHITSILCRTEVHDGASHALTHTGPRSMLATALHATIRYVEDEKF